MAIEGARLLHRVGRAQLKVGLLLRKLGDKLVPEGELAHLAPFLPKQREGLLQCTFQPLDILLLLQIGELFGLFHRIPRFEAPLLGVGRFAAVRCWRR